MLTARVGASGNYNLYLDVGDRVSELNQTLNLDFLECINGYNINAKLNLKKDYRVYYGEWEARELELNDFLLNISNDNGEFSLGEIAVPYSSKFISSAYLQGAYLAYDNYRVWGGKDSSEGLGFSSGGDSSQYGVAYINDDRRISYQLIKEAAYYDFNNSKIKYNNNHYFNYSDYYYWNRHYLSIDSTLASDFEENLKGEGLSLMFASDFKGISYDISADYKSAELEAINSRFNRGYGEYDLSFGTYYLIKNYLLQGKIEYSEDNLSKKKSLINRDFDSTFKLNYYAGLYDVYRFTIIHSTNNRYLSSTKELIKDENTVDVKLHYETRYWDYNLNFSNDNYKSIDLLIKYDPQKNYDLSLSYGLEDKLNDLDHDWDINFNYYKDMKRNITYDLDLGLSQRSNLKFDIKQGLIYSISPRHQVSISVDLAKYFNSDSELRKGLTCNYNYYF